MVDSYFNDVCLDNCELQPRAGWTECRLLCQQTQDYWTDVLDGKKRKDLPKLENPIIDGVDLNSIYKDF